MKSYEFSRYYNPKLGKFIYKHKGNGLIVDNILKPMRSVMSTVFKKFAKPIAKKALESGISHTGETLGKKISEKSGDLIMKKLGNIRKTPKTKQTLSKPVRKQEESTDMLLNRIISGNGIKRKR